MRKELRRYSSIGNKAGILLLCRKVLTGQMEDLSSVGASCSFINGIELNFKCGIIAFEEIHLISISDNKCQANKIIYSNDENIFIAQLCRYCLETLIDLELIQIEYLKYNEVKDVFQLPMYAFKMECSVYRNLLITFGALLPEGTLFSINNYFESDLAKHISKKHKISQNQLLAKLEEERVIGEKGEEFVLKYEKQRCPFTLTQQRKIKQISTVDASAGFDILSLNDECSEEKRYIEVKTYSGQVHFYWSANEIEAAKLRGGKYYLYIVDYSQIESEGYIPIIIQNPYDNVRDFSIWDIEPSSYLISSDSSSDEIRSMMGHSNIVPENPVEPYPLQNEEPYMMVAEAAYETYKWENVNQEILHIFGNNGTILVAGYKSKKQLAWILETGLYNIRLGRRIGSVTGKEKCIDEAENLVLYDIYNHESFQVYDIISHSEKNKDEMLALKYPSKHPGSIYMTFAIKRNATIEAYMDKDMIKKLFQYLDNHQNGMPLFIEPTELLRPT